MTLENHCVCFNTNTFQLTVDNVVSSKEFEEVSLNSKDYLSVLMLPLCYGNEEDNTGYYAISDTHLEYSHNNEWELPNLYLDTETFSNVYDGNELNNNVINSIMIWDSIDKLNELLGMDVQPIDGSTCGVITSCFFEEEEHKDNNARWIATYYDGEKNNENVVTTITYGNDEIGNIILM